MINVLRRLRAPGHHPYTAFLGTLNKGSGPSAVYASSGAATVNAGSGSTTEDGAVGSLLFSAAASSNDTLTAGPRSTRLPGSTGSSDANRRGFLLG